MDEQTSMPPSGETRHDPHGSPATGADTSALERLEKRVEQIAHPGSWRFELPSKKLTWSAEMYRIFGVDPDSADLDLDAIVASRVHPEDRAMVDQINALVAADGKPRPATYRVVHPDGRTRWVEARGDQELDASGHVVALVGFVQDVTDREESLAEARDNAQRFRALFESARDATFLVEADSGVIGDCNRAAETLLGRPHDEIVGRHMTSLHPPDQANAYRVRFSTSTGSDSAYPELAEVLRADGAIVPVEITQAVLDVDGRSHVLATFRDVTSRDRIEGDLRALSARHHALLDAVPDIIAEVDTDKRYTWVNEAGRRFFGPDVVGRAAAEFFVGEQDTYEQVQPTFDGGTTGTVRVESRQRRSDGEERLLAWICRTLTDAEGRVVGALSTARDITERREVEERLRDSEQRHRAVVETSADGFWMLSPTGDILDVNDAYMRRSGYSRDELLAMNASDLDVFESPENRAAHAAAIMRDGHGRFVTRQRTKDGSEWLAEVSAASWPESGGHVLAFVRDITERERAGLLMKTRLRLAVAAETQGLDELLTAALDAAESLTSSSIAFFHFVDPDQEHVTLQAWSTNTLAGMCTAEVKERHYPASEAGLWAECLESGKPTVHNDYASMPDRKGLPPGHAPLVRELVVPVVRDGLVTSVIGVGNKADDYTADDVEAVASVAALVTDIAMRRRTQEEYETFFAVVPDIVCITDTNWRFERLNPAWEEVLGYTPAELTTLSIAEFIHPDDLEATMAVNARLRDGQTARGTNRCRAKDGSYRWLEWTAAPTPSGELIVAAARDVTARVDGERALRAALFELERSNRSLQEFAYVISHDLTEPLRTTSSYANLLAERYQGRLDADADDFIDFIVGGATRMQSMITDLLEYSRIGSHGGSFALVDSGAALGQALVNLRAAIDEAGATVTSDPMPTVTADKTQLLRLFQNLMGNAIKFRGADAPRVHVSAEKHGEDWVFSVRDNGIGIEPADAEGIFTMFRRAAATQGVPGTGIGLAVVRRIVERHGGRVWVESQPGEGSTFLFTLPEEPTGQDPREG